MFNKSVYLKNIDEELTSNECNMLKFTQYPGYQIYSAVQTKFEQPNGHTKNIEWVLVYLHDDPNKSSLTVTHKREITHNGIKHRKNLKPFGLEKKANQRFSSQSNHDVFIEKPFKYHQDGTVVYKSSKKTNIVHVGLRKSVKPGLYRTPHIITKKSTIKSTALSTAERIEQRRRAKSDRQTIFVRGLPRNAEQSDILDIGSAIGSITRISLIKSKEEPFEFIGRAFVVYSTPEEALNAVEYWSNLDIEGQSITASVAKPRK